MKIVQPTPIQQKCIPVGLEGKDIMGIAQTGTGKTLAFGIPLVQRLDHMPGRALVLLPTRELALQAEETFQRIAQPFNLRTAVLIGGESIYRQAQELRRQPRILIATPGRLIDHLEERRVRLDDVKILVLDEADRMLDMGFAPQLNQIMKSVPKERQTLLFSATMPNSIVKLATTYMAMPVRLEVAPAGTTSADIEQEIFIIHQESKLSLLEKLLQEYRGTVLVFSRTKFGAKKITSVVNMMGHRAAEIHSNRSQAQRREALSGFRSGKYRVLVATDIAARGIDVSNIELVVNFDLPEQSEDYVHRIGRTGRAGNKGRAISFATPNQKREIHLIERLIKKNLPVSQLPELPPPLKRSAAPRPAPAPAAKPRNNPGNVRLGPKPDHQRSGSGPRPGGNRHEGQRPGQAPRPSGNRHEGQRPGQTTRPGDNRHEGQRPGQAPRPSGNRHEGQGSGTGQRPGGHRQDSQSPRLGANRHEGQRPGAGPRPGGNRHEGQAGGRGPKDGGHRPPEGRKAEGNKPGSNQRRRARSKFRQRHQGGGKPK